MEVKRGEFLLSTAAAKLDIGVIHGYLSRSYWAKGISRELVGRSLRHSLNFGVYLGDEQVGFARVISDYTTFAYLADVFILEPYRGRGLGKWLLEMVTSHPEVSGLRRWCLLTKDAHGLYERYGFTGLAVPERWMERSG